MTDKNDTQEVSIEERNGIGSVKGDSGQQSGAMKGLAVVLACLLASGLLWLTWADEKTAEEEVAKPGRIKVNKPYEPAPEPVIYTPDPVKTLNKPEQQVRQEPVVVLKEPTNELLDASRRAPVLAFTGRIRQPSNQETTSDGQAGLPLGLFGASADNSDGLAAKLQSVTLSGTKARAIGNLHMTVPKGTHIPCTLETAMSSDQPGFISCIISRDVLGGSGQVVLMEKGSKVFGQYEGGIKRGEKRLFVLWNEARTPSGVVVSLDSPATDAVGRAGVTGKIDNKFFERFGGAILLSIISDASAFAFEQASESIDVDFNSTSEASDDAISTALEQTENIQPTLYVNQGAALNIFVARDLDFSDVYKLQRTESLNAILDRVIDTDIYELPQVVK